MKVFLLRCGEKVISIRNTSLAIYIKLYSLPSYKSDDLYSFTNEYTELLSDIKELSKSVYICGDYNIDLLKIDTNNDYCSFYENIISSVFVPKITLPTRLCDTASTLIDSVYTSVTDKDHTCGTLVRPTMYI